MSYAEKVKGPYYKRIKLAKEWQAKERERRERIEHQEKLKEAFDKGDQEMFLAEVASMKDGKRVNHNKVLTHKLGDAFIAALQRNQGDK